jgi:hypothetical protein
MRGARKLFLCRLEWTARAIGKAPGWYWWVESQDPVYHGPFELESHCRMDLAKVNGGDFRRMIWR